MRWLGTRELSGATVAREFMASVVVFLVALPLCLGIALASGVPAGLGLISGIVGGLVVGLMAGCRLQVSGPAAGLAVIVWELVQTHGLATLGIIVLLAGALQIAAGALKLGQWFRAVSPAVVRGMLAGIGVLLLGSQFHVMVDDKPRGSGVDNLLTIPQSVTKAIFPLDGSTHHMAALAGIVTIVAMVVWDLVRPEKLKMVPAPLVGVTLAAVMAAVFGFDILFVTVPADLGSAMNWIPLDQWESFVDPTILLAAVTLAAVASAETLLCATAVDALHDGPRTDYDQELYSQGIGNMICGVFGGLPITGVIVRSSANVEAGARTRLSAVWHGAWLLLFVAALPFVLELIPTASLAAILVFTGYKLVNPKAVLEMWRFSRVEALIFGATVVAIVATNLLTGILIGIGIALVRLAIRLARLEVDVERDDESRSMVLHLKGTATFLTLPRLVRVLEAVPAGYALRVELDRVGYIDHACIELFQSWERSRVSQGNTLELGWDELFHRYAKGHDPATLRFVPQVREPDDSEEEKAAA